MTDFVKNGATELPPVKQNARVVTGENYDWTAEDANKLRQAVLDLRTQDIAEYKARVAADNAIIASGAEPANVGLAPVTPTGSVITQALQDWLSRLDPDGGPIPVTSTGAVTKTLAEWTNDMAGFENLVDGITPVLDSKTRTFVQANPPSNPYSDGLPLVVGDLWFDSDANFAQYRWNGGIWEPITPTPVAGERGSMQFYVDVTPATSWSHAAANDAVAVYGGVQIGDTVTEFNDAAAYSEVRFWDGGGWVVVNVRFNGNLLVDGTVGATKVAAASITTQKLTVTNWDNLWPNGTSEIAPPAGYVSVSPADDPEFGYRYEGLPQSGTCCRFLGTTGANRYEEIRLNVRAAPGEEYYLEAWASSNGMDNCANYMFARFYDANWAQVGGATVFATPTYYQKITLSSGVAPAGTAWIRFALGADSGAGQEAGFQVVYDGIYARKKVSGAVLTADAIQTSDYDGVNIDTVNETCTTGTRVRVNQGAYGPGIITSPQGIRIGSTTLSESWFSSAITRALFFTCFYGICTAYMDKAESLTITKETSGGNSFLRVLFPSTMFTRYGTGFIMSAVLNQATVSGTDPANGWHLYHVPAVRYLSPSQLDIWIFDSRTGNIVDPATIAFFECNGLVMCSIQDGEYIYNPVP